MAHCIVQEAEEILDKEFKVLDKGFVRLVDYLGGDSRIVQAARVCYGEGTTTFRRDKALIDYLLENDHTSPFEQVVFTFHVKMPLFVARQWLRHRTARVNEISGRYSIMKNEFYLPQGEDIAVQSATNRQGRDSENVPVELQQKVLEVLSQGQLRSYEDYKALLAHNIARELARINLPLSLYTEIYWQIDLHNLFHFIKLRLDHHAQKEIRSYARVIYEIGKKVCPMAFSAFDRFILKSIKFSEEEIAIIRDAVEGKNIDKSTKIWQTTLSKLQAKNYDEFV